MSAYEKLQKLKMVANRCVYDEMEDLNCMSAHEKLKILKMVANRGVYDGLEGLVTTLMYLYSVIALQDMSMHVGHPRLQHRL